MSGRAGAVDCAQVTYDTLAPVYDGFTAGYDHETWLARILEAAGVQGSAGRALDVACGTGRSFAPLLRRGWDVSACDISPGMVAVARRRTPDVPVFAADMRALPAGGTFDLVTCLNDAVNYLLDGDGLRDAIASAARRLRPGGLYVFDTNTLGTFRTAFAEQAGFDHDGWRYGWRGEGRADAAPGVVAAATVSAFADGQAVTARNLQRHHPIEEVCGAIRAAGLQVVSVLGQTTGCVLHRDADELSQTKTVFVARRAGPGTKEAT
jgi:SAM-dependent methyltransferase